MLKGLVSLVTGGASGLGKATAIHLAKLGSSVIICDLPESEGESVAQSIEGKAIFSPCDVSSEGDVQNALDLCKKEFGRLDVSVNCAAMARAFMIAYPPTESCLKDEEYNIVMESNLYGTFNVCRLSAQLMSQNEPSTDGQRGVIINTGDISAEHATKGQSLLAAAKGAIAAMTLPMSRDLAPMGIRVLTISPGLFDTPLTADYTITEEVQAYLKDQIPFPKRFGTPEEFANVVSSIITNPMLNGETIRVTGGLRYFQDS